MNYRCFTLLTTYNKFKPNSLTGGGKMETPVADVMVHIDESLSKEALAKLEEAVRGDECVISVGFPAGKPHLMLVAFNPERTSAKKILDRVMEQGVRAELVGM